MNDLRRSALGHLCGGPLAHALAAVASVAMATAVAIFLDSHVTLAVLVLVYLAAVVAVSYWLTFLASALTATLAVLALNFFFIPPRGTLTVHATENLLTLAALLGVAMLVGSMASTLRANAARALERERRARDLQSLAGSLSALDDESDIALAVHDIVRDAAGVKVTIAVASEDGALKAAASGAEVPDRLRDAMACCAKERQPLGPGTGRWDRIDDWHLPLLAGDECFGVLSVPAHGRTEDDREHLGTIADLVAGALRRARHAAAATAARREAESQALRNALLAAVSHDFRTPLASIIGAASSLRDQRERLDEASRTRLLGLIGDEANHLSAVTENTLQWVRLASTSPVLRKDWQSVEEVVGTVLARVRRRDPERRIKAHVPPTLPLVRADGALLAQLLENLLDNALKYSQQAIELRAQQDSRALRLDVLDSGPGVPEEDRPHLFQSFYRGAAAKGTRGAGLGLAVARAIATAHGGTLDVAPRDGGGSCFHLCLPVDEMPDAAPEAGGLT